MSADRNHGSTSREDRQDELLGSVLDGGRVDWSEADSMAITQADQLRVGALRDIARIVEFNRELQRESKVCDREAPPFSPDAVRWGDLVLLEPLGTGSSGQVWRSWDVRLHREVALKFLQTEKGLAIGGDAGVESPLLAEARALARMRHPAVVAVHGIAEHDGRVGMWMELLRGETLAAAIERGPLRQAEVARIGRELALALDAVHEAGLVHRDVKPANVVLEPGGRVVLTDFGLGRPRAAVSELRRTSGTPMFMAPELLAGEPASPRSDLYALGATLRWALTGRPPFAARTVSDLQVEVARGPATDLRAERPHASAPLVESIERAMAPNPGRRFASAAELALAIAGEPAEGVAARHTLPREADSFVGRDADLDQLEGRVEIGSRLVTLVGAGGMGKTRLAVRYGWDSLRRWPGGVWFCDLTEARDLNGIASAVATSLGVPLGKDDPVMQLGHAIAGRRRCLVILDNFEQVSELAGTTVVRWLERAPEARWLVTSREGLGVRGEEVQDIEPLTPESAAELFVARARRQVPQFDPQGTEADAVTELMRLTEGMPLAIELAAARVKVMSAAEIVARMRERFHALGGPGTGRHGSLVAAIDGSWELLRPWEKAAWAQCSVFEGGFAQDAAENVVDLSPWPEAPSIVDVVQSLLDKSLLRVSIVETEQRERIPRARFGMYVSLQEYARRKLREESPLGGASDTEAERMAEKRHGTWYARLGTREAIGALYRNGGVKRWMRLERELDNLLVASRRAAGRGDGVVAAAAYGAAWAVFELKGPTGVAVELGRQVLREGRLGRQDKAIVLRTLGYAELCSGAVEDARAHLEAALATARELEDRSLEAGVLNSLGNVASDQSRMDEARVHREMALEVARATGDRYEEANALNSLSIIHRDQGHIAEAIAYAEQSLTIARSAGDRRSEGTALGNLGVLNHDRGSFEKARAHYEESLAIHREVGNRRFEGSIFTNLGTLNSDQGSWEEARAQFEAALAIYREVGLRRSEGIALNNLGDWLAEQGRAEEALAHFEEALAIHRELGDLRLEGITLGGLGLLHDDRGDLEAASSQYEAGLAKVRAAGDPRHEGDILSHLASVLHRQGSIEAARDALATAEPLLRRVDARLELAQLLCVRAELENASGSRETALATLAEAEALGAELGVGPDSDLGRALAGARRLRNAK